MSYPCRKTLLYKWHLWLLGISSARFRTGSLCSRGCSDRWGNINVKGRNIEQLFLFFFCFPKKYEHDKARGRGCLAKKLLQDSLSS